MTNTERISANNEELRECIEMAEKLPDAGTSVEMVLQSKTVTPTKAAQEVVADASYTALEKVTVNAIPDEYIVPDGTLNIGANGERDVTAYKTVSVNVPVPDGYIKPSGTLDITENGIHDVAAYAEVNVDVAGNGGGDSNLPDGYKRADYIQFTSAQIVDTGVRCTQDSKIKLAFTREKTSQHYMFGVASSDNTAALTAYFGGNWRFGDKAASKNPVTNEDMIYSAVLSNSEITTTSSKTEISGVNDFETIGTLLLGACRNSSGSVPSATFEGKIFYFSIWQSGEQIQKLIPVTDGTAYRFYDTVSGTFFDSITDTPLDGGNL